MHVVSSQQFFLFHQVSAYFKRFDEAERLLIKSERADLALQMHMKFGRWFA